MKKRLQHDMNVIPFIDVMLVLLLVFMVTAPLIHPSLQVQLPQSSASASPTHGPVSLTLTHHHTLYFQGENGRRQKIASQAIVARLQHYWKQHKSLQKRLIIRADKRVNYQQVITLIQAANRAGCQAIALQTTT